MKPGPSSLGKSPLSPPHNLDLSLALHPWARPAFGDSSSSLCILHPQEQITFAYLQILCKLLFSHVQFFPTPWTATRQASLSFTISRILLKLMSIELVMPSNHLILCHPLLLLPSIFPSIRVFSNDSVLGIKWPKYWSFSFSFSNEYSGLISFRIDWFDPLAVQGTLKSLLQHHSLKASVLHANLALWSNCHIHTRLLEKP